MEHSDLPFLLIYFNSKQKLIYNSQNFRQLKYLQYNAKMHFAVKNFIIGQHN